MSKTNHSASKLRIRLLPGLAWKGIASNKNVYYPYLAAGIFSVFTYFIFASIIYNDIVKMMPKSAYMLILMVIGKGLLAIILLLFLIYANRFLVKRRRREFGLYHMLGLEKKHIGGMMLFENFLLYVITLCGGTVFGLVLSKLFFLLLLRLCRMPAEIGFVFEPAAFRETMAYFGIVYLINYAESLWEVGKARPIELMSGSKKGEKEPRFLWLYALIGMAALGGGYYCSITAKVDSMIFMNFFLAVFLVVIGTYLLFTSGSIAFLKWMKTKKKTYYRPRNFITVSGMLYRMKKSAAGLSNICIFSTMAMITLICTVTLGIGLDEIVHFLDPYDLKMSYREEKVTEQDVAGKVEELEDKYGLTALRTDIYNEITLHVQQNENRFEIQTGEDYEAEYEIDILVQEDYNRIENRLVSLDGDETLIYCNGRDFGYDTVNFFGRIFRVQEELDGFFPYPKADDNAFDARYMMVVKDREARDACVRAWCEANGVVDIDEFIESDTIQRVKILLQGEDGKKAGWIEEFSEWGQSQPGFESLKNGLDWRENSRVTYGSLLFIGILFGLIFFMCLVLIMYYKQVTEGYEDRNHFDIMQKVGMSDLEIQGTVHKQILMVFGLPLAGALFHTVAGMFMVKALFATISLYDKRLIVGSIIGVSALFAAVYGVSYLITARSYYKIVRQGDAHR